MHSGLFMILSLLLVKKNISKNVITLKVYIIK